MQFQNQIVPLLNGDVVAEVPEGNVPRGVMTMFCNAARTRGRHTHLSAGTLVRSSVRLRRSEQYRRTARDSGLRFVNRIQHMAHCRENRDRVMVAHLVFVAVAAIIAPELHGAHGQEFEAVLQPFAARC